MRRQMFVITIVMLVAAVLLAHPAAAQVEPLSIWLYNSDTGQLVNLVPDEGTISMHSFPPLPDAPSYPSIATVSRDGRYMAACVVDHAGGTSIRVYDIAGGMNQVAAYIHGPAMACSLDRYSFNEDGSMLAFGLLNHYPNDPADTRPDWDLIVMSVNDSSIRYRLDSNSPLFPGGAGQYGGMLPFVMAFDTMTVPGGMIAFRPVMWATEGMPEYDSLVWNLAENSVVKGGYYGKAGLNLLLGPAEAIWLEINPSLPQGTIMGPGYPFNVVTFSNRMGETYPVFHNAAVLFNALFIDNGHKIAVQSYNEPGPAQWAYLDRDGTIGSLPVPGDVYEVRGTSDGLIFLSASTLNAAPELHRIVYNGGSAAQESVLWSGQPGEFWRILWATPFTGNPGLPAFSPIMGGGPVLTVGGRAQVQTTEGDALRVRVGPGFGSAVGFYLAAGTQVTLLDGPALADGSNWWLVQTADGRSGWAVEGVMDNGTYLQTLVPIP